jgi:hypothetical protein
MPMSTFPHSMSVVKITDPAHENHGEEARVHYVMGWNGHQANPLLTMKHIETGLVISASVNQVEVVRDGLQVSI